MRFTGICEIHLLCKNTYGFNTKTLFKINIFPSIMPNKSELKFICQDTGIELNVSVHKVVRMFISGSAFIGESSTCLRRTLDDIIGFIMLIGPKVVLESGVDGEISVIVDLSKGNPEKHLLKKINFHGAELYDYLIADAPITSCKISTIELSKSRQEWNELNMVYRCNQNLVRTIENKFGVFDMGTGDTFYSPAASSLQVSICELARWLTNNPAPATLPANLVIQNNTGGVLIKSICGRLSGTYSISNIFYMIDEPHTKLRFLAETTNNFSDDHLFEMNINLGNDRLYGIDLLRIIYSSRKSNYIDDAALVCPVPYCHREFEVANTEMTSEYMIVGGKKYNILPSKRDISNYVEYFPASLTMEFTYKAFLKIP